MNEPLLSTADLRIWNTWTLAALAHARTREHTKRVVQARRIIGTALETANNWAVMWSGGKDSTAMADLALGLDSNLELVSEKDDLDFPGEREYIEKLATRWGARLTILEPSISPAAWMAEHGADMRGDADIHSRAAGLSKACFYGVVEAYTSTRPIMLGLRAEEGQGRNKNRAKRGTVYRKRSDQWVACPLSDWSGIDVYAYLISRQIPILPIYKCVAMMHKSEPWRIRKSWWLPGSSARHGQATWLRRYYPSLYERLVSWVPSTQMLG
jgi:3'-phosphoadenosine 5'-phosphosulfate sulfotransferase (PAPS reductase)/FAD synthetase